MIQARLRATLAVLALPLLAGCGGAAPLAAKTSVSTEELGTVDGASAAVNHAERAIDELLGAAAQSTIAAEHDVPQSVGGQVAPSPSPPPPPPPAVTPIAPAPAGAPPADRSRAMDKDGREAVKQQAGGGDACSTACSALASMERATEHLCGLTGADDARCTAARTRVQGASARVRAACPVCSGS